jgi:hypothetical protein|tara:strand:+ start:120 stop:737 length:618 start_codon:yes stop_codon:yes gene_type:complete
MSQERNIKWLNDRRIVYRQDPIHDVPDIDNESYMYFDNGTYEYYRLFYTPSKITTYKSLKWHLLVLYYLNMDNIINSDFVTLARFIANKENGFVTFFIKNKLLENIIKDVLMQGGDPPVNKIRKIIFKDYNGMSFNEKMKVVGQLSGRQKLDKETIYQCMIDIYSTGTKITIRWMAELLGVSKRTIHRHMCDALQKEKTILNEEI